MANTTLALHGKDIAGTSGIIAETAGQSFEDMGRVVKESMEKTDASIIGVMEDNIFPDR
jgi:L-cysteine desulfidase